MYVDVCMCVCVYIRMYTCECVWVCVCTCVCVCMCVPYLLLFSMLKSINENAYILKISKIVRYHSCHNKSKAIFLKKVVRTKHS